MKEIFSLVIHHHKSSIISRWCFLHRILMRHISPGPNLIARCWIPGSLSIVFQLGSQQKGNIVEYEYYQSEVGFSVQSSCDSILWVNNSEARWPLSRLAMISEWTEFVFLNVIFELWLAAPEELNDLSSFITFELFLITTSSTSVLMASSITTSSRIVLTVVVLLPAGLRRFLGGLGLWNCFKVSVSWTPKSSFSTDNASFFTLDFRLVFGVLEEEVKMSVLDFQLTSLEKKALTRFLWLLGDFTSVVAAFGTSEVIFASWRRALLAFLWFEVDLRFRSHCFITVHDAWNEAYSCKLICRTTFFCLLLLMH